MNNDEVQKVRAMMDSGDKDALLAYTAGDVDSYAAETVARQRARRKERNKARWDVGPCVSRVDGPAVYRIITPGTEPFVARVVAEVYSLDEAREIVADHNATSTTPKGDTADE